MTDKQYLINFPRTISNDMKTSSMTGNTDDYITMREKEIWKEIPPNNATTTKDIMRPYYYDNCTITLNYVHVNIMFNLQHFAIYNVSSAILYRAIGIDLLVVRQNSYGFERSGPRQCDVQLAMCEDWLGQEQPHCVECLTL